MFIQEILRATMGMAQPENAKKGIDFSWGKKNINNVKMHSSSLQKFSFFITVKSKRYRQAVSVYSVLLKFIILCYLVSSNSGSTVWKFHDFSITQILHELYFGDSRSAKSTILTQFEALNLDFYDFLNFWKVEI